MARTTSIRTNEQQKQDAEKITKYRSLEDEIRARVSDPSLGCTRETFSLTSKLLRLNPEYYTIWNVRRRCLTFGLLSRRSASCSRSKELLSGTPITTRLTSSDNLSSSSSEGSAILPAPTPPTTGPSGIICSNADVHMSMASKEEKKKEVAKADDEIDLSNMNILQDELMWMIPLLKEFPKCYWIWNYRLWVLDQCITLLPVAVARRFWEHELGLVGQMLTRDRRNFHAWGYRRQVVAQLESPLLEGKSMVKDEFAYTDKMIRQDLSNFSAWHNRAKLIPRFLSERGADSAQRKAFLDEEFDYIRDALNVGPEDQSLWYYHQFLIFNLIEDQEKNLGEVTTIVPGMEASARADYVRREIETIKELLEDYADIKWIYEGLVEYTIALARFEERQVLAPDEIEHLREWVGMLRSLDPMRNGRWDDVTREFCLG